MVEVSLKYEKDPQLLLDIVSAMPKRVDNTLTLHRNKLLGNIPKSREEFNPWSLLDKMDGGDKMMVLDSCKDLPVDWREIDMRERYGVNPDRDGGVEGDTQSTGTGTSEGDSQSTGASDGTGSETDVGPITVPSDESDEGVNDDLDATVQADPEKPPKRVLVFTTVMLLGLLSMCRWGSVDGTFKSSTKHWKQLFVMLCNFNGTWLPVAFGWLPDKNLLSYQLFLILVLEAFFKHKAEIHNIYGKSKLKLKKIKMDFELGIIQAFQPLFTIKGCLFHYSQACKLNTFDLSLVYLHLLLL